MLECEFEDRCLLLGSGSVQSPELVETLGEAIGRAGRSCVSLGDGARPARPQPRSPHAARATKSVSGEADLVDRFGDALRLSAWATGGASRGGRRSSAINRSSRDLKKNRRPDLGYSSGSRASAHRVVANGHASAQRMGSHGAAALRARDDARDDRDRRVGERRNGRRESHCVVPSNRDGSGRQGRVRRRRRRFRRDGIVHRAAARPAFMARPRGLRNTGAGSGLRPRCEVVPAGGRSLVTLRRRRCRVQPGGVRHARSPRRGR